MGADRGRGAGQRPAKQAFADCGFGLEDAALRSLVVFAAGVGLLHASGPIPAAPPELRDRFLDFVLRP